MFRFCYSLLPVCFYVVQASSKYPELFILLTFLLFILVSLGLFCPTDIFLFLCVCMCLYVCVYYICVLYKHIDYS